MDAVAGESDTTNNCSDSVQVTVSEVEPPPQSNPDLVVESPSVDDSSPAAGASFTLSATVRNAGDWASVGTSLRYYRSTDATIATSDTDTGTDSVGGLAASGSSCQSVDLTAPSTSGTWYYGACVDAVAGESDTANDCSASVRVTVSEVEPPTQSNPDLVVESPTANDSSPTAGASFTLSATVRNAGDGASAGTTLRYYRSTDATIATSDTAAGTDSMGGLAASGSGSQSVDLTAPSTSGTWYYGACVDSVTGESDTTNNCSAFRAGHGVGGGAASADQPGPGGGVAPSVERRQSWKQGRLVHPVGDGARTPVTGRRRATTLRYYRSTDAAITTSDTEVGTDAVGGTLRVGASSSRVDRI